MGGVLVGSCARCGAPATLRCTFCGRTVCHSCLDADERMCPECAQLQKKGKGPVAQKMPPSRQMA